MTARTYRCPKGTEFGQNCTVGRIIHLGDRLRDSRVDATLPLPLCARSRHLSLHSFRSHACRRSCVRPSRNVQHRFDQSAVQEEQQADRAGQSARREWWSWNERVRGRRQCARRRGCWPCWRNNPSCKQTEESTDGLPDLPRTSLEMRRRPSNMPELQKVEQELQARLETELHRHHGQIATHHGPHP